MYYDNLIHVLNHRKALSSVGITFIKSNDVEEFVSYKDLHDKSLLALRYLQQNGLKPKDELVMQIEDGKSFFIVFWACLFGGIIPVPLTIGNNDDHREKLFRVWQILNNPYLIIARKDSLQQKNFSIPEEFSFLQAKIEDRTLALDGIFSMKVNGTVFSATANDIAFIQFSSGSTGSPKGVVLTHRNLISNMEAISEAAGYCEEDSMLSWMPYTHDMGMIGFHLNPLFCGINQFWMSTNLFIRHPALWLDKASEHRISVLCSPNFGYRYLLKYLKDEARDWILSSVRILYNGAEPISASLCEEFIEKLAAYRLPVNALCPVYGLAEASVAVAISGIHDEVKTIQVNRHQLRVGDVVKFENDKDKAATFVNVGKPIRYCSLKIADRLNNAQPDNVIGMILIQGDNVTKEYYNNKSATDETFYADGWLNTGDLGFICDGDLYITGRQKDIIFINGQNFYPHDIEAKAELLPGVELNKIAVTGYFDEATQKDEVIAFVFHRDDLKKFLPVQKSLKAHINRIFGFELGKILPVKNIPRTTSGKLQRFKLLKKYLDGELKEVERALSALQVQSYKQDTLDQLNDDERSMLGMWQHVLGRDIIDINCSFFDIGGNSLKAAELSMIVQKKYQIDLSPERIYALKTLRSMAATIHSCSNKQYTPITQRKKSRYYDISPFQKRLYYAWLLDRQSIAYNIPTAFLLKGDVDVMKLRACIKSIVARHDSLRMSFHLKDSLKLKVHSNKDVRITVLKRKKEEWKFVLKTLITPFDLENEQLIRFYLLEETESKEFLLFLDVHHIICDGQSIALLFQELFEAYLNGSQKIETASYVDFLQWDAQQLHNGRHDDHISFWREELKGEIPVLELPYDRKRPVVLSFEGKRVSFTLDEVRLAGLRALAVKHQVTLHALMFTIYSIFISKYSSQDDIMIGIPVSVRSHPDVQRTIGMFVNTLPIRCQVKSEWSFEEMLSYTAGKLKNAISHHVCPFDDLLHAVSFPNDPSRNPLFDTMFVYQNMGIPYFEDRQMSAEWYAFDTGYSKFDLSMEVFEDNGKIKYSWEYATRLFNDITILNLSEGFERIMDKILANPLANIVDLSPVSKEEWTKFIVDENARDDEAGAFLSVQELFEQRVVSQPEAVALRMGQTIVSYSRLNELANKIAAALCNKGIGNSELIGIFLPKSPELVISILGVFKSGAAYLPIDIDTPADRLKFILNDSLCKYLITDPKFSTTQFGANVEVLEVQNLMTSTNHSHSLLSSQPNDLAYVIYTSGTTGGPKGVMIEQGSLANYITWAADQYTKGERCSFALYSSISFDLTVTSIFTPLVSGNEIVIYEGSNADALIVQVLKEGVTNIVKLTPSHLRLLRSNQLLTSQCSVKRFIVGGENLDRDLAMDVYKMTDERVEIYNEYGPTEATVGCMIYKFNPSDAGDSVPIGKSIINSKIYLLDKDLKPVAVNMKGEIYVAGDGLARGYLLNDELTQSRFIDNPFDKNRKMYKTGDIAKRMHDGNLMYIGRNDGQLKLNGFRVELSEIENELINSKYVDQAVVLPDQDFANRLNAYYILKQAFPEVEESDLRNYLAERLPHYMIPTRFVQLLSMPLTKNGKVDVDELHRLRNSKRRPLMTDSVTPIEEISLEIWKAVLNKEDIGINDNFFELGGDSIKAVQISSRLFQAGISVKIKDILTYHTIRYISHQCELIDDHKPYIQDVANGEFRPTPIQAWFFNNQFANPNYFTQSILLQSNQLLDIGRLERTFETLINHHDALRLNFNIDRHVLFYNSNHLNASFNIEVFTMTDEKSLIDICSDLRRRFDLSDSLLIKSAIIRKEDGSEFLFITAHHLIVDGVSWRILLEDLFKVYTQDAHHGKIDLGPKTASFSLWSESLNRLSSTKIFDDESYYWNQIQESNFTLPRDFETIDSSARNRAVKRVRLDPEMTFYLLNGAHASYNSDVSIILNAALVDVLHRWTGKEHFVIEQENHGRHLEDLHTSRTVGWFTAMYPVRLTYKDSIDKLIKSIKESMRKVPHNGIGYGINYYLKNGLKQSSEMTEVRFNYLGQFGTELDNDLMSVSNFYTGLDTDPDNHLTAMLEINSMVIGNEFTAEIIYSNKSFMNSTIQHVANMFIESLSTILTYLSSEGDLHFTPSDFSATDLDEEEIKMLFQ